MDKLMIKTIFWIIWWFIYRKFGEKIDNVALPFLKYFIFGLLIKISIEVFVEQFLIFWRK